MVSYAWNPCTFNVFIFSTRTSYWWGCISDWTICYSRVLADITVSQCECCPETNVLYGNRQIDKVPPSHNALYQHILRAVYQSGHIWVQMLLRNPAMPSPSEWGWTKLSDNWIPLWGTLPEASKCCQELIKCSCKALWRGRCKCCKANLPFTKLCLYNGQCERESRTSNK